MKFQYIFLLLLFTCAGNAYSQCFTLTINACIDYDDYLNVSGDSLWWQDFGGSPPGTHPDCNGQDVTVNGVDWYPWNSVFIFPEHPAGCSITATFLSCSNICDVIQEATAANNWHGIYEFNDEAPGGPHYYSFELQFFCPTVTTSGTVYQCGDSTAIYATGGSAYTWSPDTGLSCADCPNPEVSVGQTTLYTVTVTDSNNCSGTGTVTVNVDSLNLITTSSGVKCFGQNNGKALVGNTGGYPPVSILWSTGATGNIDSNLTGGIYTVTLTDAVGCTDSADVAVSAPSGPIMIDLNVLPATCQLNNGSIAANVTGGTLSYTYIWNSSPEQYIDTAVNLSPDTYMLMITDANGCADSASATVDSSGEAINLILDTVNTSCGIQNGSATVTAVGTGPFSYVWNNGGDSSTINNLGAGTYFVTVTGLNGCSATSGATINSSGADSLVITSDKSMMCSNDSARICAPPGYVSYSWSTGQNISCIYVETAGDYYLTVMDSTGCTGSSNHVAIRVYPLPPVEISVLGDTFVCYGAVTYQWYYNDTAINGDTLNVLIATQPGTYTVGVTDTNGCLSFSSPVMITGIKELPGAAIKVEPNPTSGNWQLTVSNDMFGSETEVFDAAGRLVYKSKITNIHSEIEVPFAGGVYLLRLTYGTETLVRKLVKL